MRNPHYAPVRPARARGPPPGRGVHCSKWAAGSGAHRRGAPRAPPARADASWAPTRPVDARRRGRERAPDRRAPRPPPPRPSRPSRPHAGKDAKATAAKAAAAVKKNSWAKSRKPRHSVVFHRPKTLKRTRDPKYTRKRCAAGVPPPGTRARGATG
jgi:hypothetical protein